MLPTRGRCELAAARLQDIAHRPLVLIVNEDRRALDVPADLRGATVLIVPADFTCAQKLEAGFRAATTSHVIYLVDDCLPAPDLVAEACLAYRTQLGARDGVLALNDGVEHGRQACLGLVSRKFYFDHVYPQPYEHYFIDTELSAKARWLGVYAYAPGAQALHFFHEGQQAQRMADESQIFAERMNQFRAATPRHAPHLMVGLPIYGAAHPLFIQGLIALTAQPPCKVTFQFNTWNSLVSLARNQIAAEFLASDCTHLLFIDADIGFEARHVAQLLARDLDIVGGLYPYKKAGPAEYVSNALEQPTPEADGLQELKYLGTGFLLIKRRVFEILREQFPALEYVSDYQRRIEHDFFSVEVKQRRHLSEDWSFCERARACGFKIFGDTRVKLKHAGSAIYPMPATLNPQPATK